MADKSKIEWTDATWNPIRGCSRVSEGCRHCYAERVAARFSQPGQAYEGLAQLVTIGAGTEKERTEAHWTGKLRSVPEVLDQPLRWRKPRKIFVNSMSDLFHEGVSDPELLGIFAVMGNSHLATHGWDQTHTFQVLTKRPQRMLDFMRRLRWRTGLGLVNISGRGYLLNYLPELAGESGTWKSVFDGKPAAEGTHLQPAGWQPPQVWLGVSIEDQKTANERVDLLLQTPAAVRWVSAEPLLGPVDLTQVGCTSDSDPGYSALEVRPDDEPVGCDEFDATLDWVVVGGESGPGARPMHPEWARSLRDQCQAAGVRFFFKQWGEWAPGIGRRDAMVGEDGHVLTFPFNGGGHLDTSYDRMTRIGKKRAGRELDGRKWNEYPEVRA